MTLTTRAFLLSACLFVLPFAALTAEPAAQTRAQAFAQEQDFANDPPSVGFDLGEILAWAAPNRAYLGSGPNFPVPGPPVPPWVTTILVICTRGAQVISYSPRCITRWESCLVKLTFDDGSDFVYESTFEVTQCNNGTSVYTRRVRQSADAGPPAFVDNMQIEWHYEDTFVQRRRGHRVTTPASSSWSYAASPVRPAVEADDFEFHGGPGSTLDLRQNPAFGGPLFVTDTPALLRCDTILMDPGVTLTDLFSQPPIVLPGSLATDVELAVPAFAALDAAAASVRVLVQNTGNQADMFLLTSNDPLGWTPGGPQMIPLAAGAMQSVLLPVLVPAGTPRGTRSPLTVQVTSSSMPSSSQQHACQLVFDHAGVLRFGDGTPGCLGPHTLDISGPVVAGGASTQITCDAVLPGAIGLWLYGVPFGNYAGLLVPALGAELLVDPFAPFFVTDLTVATLTGRFVTSVQWPYVLSLRGLDLTTQAVSLGDAGCVLQVFPMTSSAAIQFVIQ